MQQQEVRVAMASVSLLAVIAIGLSHSTTSTGSVVGFVLGLAALELWAVYRVRSSR